MQKTNTARAMQVSHRRADFDINTLLADISNTANSVQSTLTNTLAPLVPLQKTMTDALAQIGIYPPNDIKSVSDAFAKYIAAPQGVNLNTQNVTAGILGFIKEQVQAKQSGANLTGVNKTIADGGQSTLERLQGELMTGDIFKSPVFWVGVTAFLGLVFWLAFKK